MNINENGIGKEIIITYTWKSVWIIGVCMCVGVQEINIHQLCV